MHNEISPHTCQKGCHPKRKQITNVGENVDKRETLYTVGGNKLVQPLWKTEWRFLRLKIELQNGLKI